MKRPNVFMFGPASIVLALVLASSASAHDRFSLRLGGGMLSAPAAAFFFQRGPSRAQLFFPMGHPWMVSPRGDPYSHPATAMAPYQVTPPAGLSGADASGALHVDGYRVQPSGWLRVSVEPHDAEVVVDGFPVMVDQTTGTSGSLGFLVGPHHVEARKSGFQLGQSEVEVRQASELFLQVKLARD